MPVTSSPLVVEVAVTSPVCDLEHKPALYAAAGVGQYWVVDLRARRVARHVVVHRDPGDARYASVESYSLSQPLEVLGLTIRLSDVLDRSG